MAIDPYSSLIKPTGSGFKAQSCRVAAVNRTGSATSPSPARTAEAGSFQNLLRAVSNATELSAGNPNEKPAPLTEAQRIALSQRIKIQLTESLLRAFSDEPSEKTDHLSFTPNMFTLSPHTAISVAEASTTRHDPSENRTAASGYFDDMIAKAATTYAVDPDLIRGVIMAESAFDPLALSPKGAMGLMQLMPQTADELGVKDPYDPAANIMGGTRYLRRLMDRYQGDISLALAAYNWGMGNLETRGDRLPTETKNYVRKITEFFQEQKTTAV